MERTRPFASLKPGAGRYLVIVTACGAYTSRADFASVFQIMATLVGRVRRWVRLAGSRH